MEEKTYKDGYNACINEVLKILDGYTFLPKEVDGIINDICKKLHSMKKEG